MYESSVEKVDTHWHNVTKYFLFPHLDFSIAYHKDHVIAVNLTSSLRERFPLRYGEDLDVDFSYSVKWIETGVPYENRLALHLMVRGWVTCS